MAHAACGSDGGGADGDESGGHQAGLGDAGAAWADTVSAANARYPVRTGAGADDEDRSHGAVIDVGRPAARWTHGDRLSPGRHRATCRAARAGCPALPARGRADQERRGCRQTLSRTDAGSDPGLIFCPDSASQSRASLAGNQLVMWAVGSALLYIKFSAVVMSAGRVGVQKKVGDAPALSVAGLFGMMAFTA